MGRGSKMHTIVRQWTCTLFAHKFDGDGYFLEYDEKHGFYHDLQVCGRCGVTRLESGRIPAREMKIEKGDRLCTCDEAGGVDCGRPEKVGVVSYVTPFVFRLDFPYLKSHGTGFWVDKDAHKPRRRI